MIYGANVIIRSNYVWVEIPHLHYSFHISKTNSIAGGSEGEVEQNTFASVIDALILRHEHNMEKITEEILAEE